jgi:hypothetical protein
LKRGVQVVSCARVEPVANADASRSRNMIRMAGGNWGRQDGADGASYTFSVTVASAIPDHRDETPAIIIVKLTIIIVNLTIF